jgi:hypothetical protein
MPTVTSLEELLSDATAREPFLTTDSKSGARFERVTINGERHILKHLHVDDDWIMRATGDLTGRPALVWTAGLLDRLPPSIDSGIVGIATGLGRNQWGAALLMRDLGEWLVPEGDEPVPVVQHLGFLDHMAELHATFWGWTDTVGLEPPMHRFLEFSPQCVGLEEARGWPDLVPRLIIEGWQKFSSVGSQFVDLVRDPTPLVDALAALPQTLVHGDWKFGNLGTHPDGRTILLDWAVPGQSCGTTELAWYLSLNSARLPISKEASIDAYRSSLEDHGVDTNGWWDRAMAVGLLAGVVWFGWEKALGGPGPELSWWLQGAAEGLRCL